MDRNLTSAFLTVRCFLPGMKVRRSGSIITLSSASGRKPSGHTLVAYGAAKAGVQIFTKDLAAQVGPYGIRANCLAPETILTEKNKQWIPADTQRSLAESLGPVDNVFHLGLGVFALAVTGANSARRPAELPTA
ncbi:SDR family NAD(P)-dependent oxidoreductase [Micromonospora sp. IBHARD004]|uniref:SDR family NAD(P)-dependent oxidoreductase n=1 Tax=Micromonospora sp. IBHARD004 TaxID=3457764 RepID=UPI004058554A